MKGSRNMYEKRMRGVVIPTITPMMPDGTVDEQSVENFTEYLIQAGANCLYPNGTNGESLLLTAEERDRIAQIMVEKNDHRIAAFIQCGSMTTAETRAHALHSVKIGADGIGIMSPAVFPMDEEALFNYYSEVVSALPADFPVYVYNIPGCTTNDVTPRLLCRLMEKFTNFVGIKYSSPNLIRVQDYFNQINHDFDLLIGCDSLFLQCLVTGGVGTVTGPGSIFHERFTRLYRQYRDGDFQGAIATQKQIVKTDRDLAAIPGIPALKALLKMRGVIRYDNCRGPLRPLSKEEYEVLERVLDQYYKEEGL